MLCIKETHNKMTSKRNVKTSHKKLREEEIKTAQQNERVIKFQNKSYSAVKK